RRVMGTLPYLAPELMFGATYASSATDQYALGVLVYQCATGRLPFFAPDAYALMAAVAHTVPPPPSAVGPSVPPACDARALRPRANHPAARFSSVRGFGSGLLAFADRAPHTRGCDEFGGDAPRDEVA